MNTIPYKVELEDQSGKKITAAAKPCSDLPFFLYLPISFCLSSLSLFNFLFLPSLFQCLSISLIFFTPFIFPPFTFSGYFSFLSSPTNREGTLIELPQVSCPSTPPSSSPSLLLPPLPSLPPSLLFLSQPQIRRGQKHFSLATSETGATSKGWEEKKIVFFLSSLFFYSWTFEEWEVHFSHLSFTCNSKSLFLMLQLSFYSLNQFGHSLFPILKSFLLSFFPPRFLSS